MRPEERKGRDGGKTEGGTIAITQSSAGSCVYVRCPLCIFVLLHLTLFNAPPLFQPTHSSIPTPPVSSPIYHTPTLCTRDSLNVKDAHRSERDQGSLHTRTQRETDTPALLYNNGRGETKGIDDEGGKKIMSVMPLLLCVSSVT